MCPDLVDMHPGAATRSTARKISHEGRLRLSGSGRAPERATRRSTEARRKGRSQCAQTSETRHPPVVDQVLRCVEKGFSRQSHEASTWLSHPDAMIYQLPRCSRLLEGEAQYANRQRLAEIRQRRATAHGATPTKRMRTASARSRSYYRRAI